MQQTFGGIARVAPIWATAIFQAAGPSVPCYIASGIVAVVSLLAFRVKKERRGGGGGVVRSKGAASCLRTYRISNSDLPSAT
ncbi:MAG: hypothetical protein HY700_04965 [Gemmatimonadetes bacterium]|nr:hypothetical protein [Gemmatimonadota bacterium]